jgi:peptidoglycan/LPS O-acetylase OafA/YrhL
MALGNTRGSAVHRVASSDHLPVVDGLRGVAILLVFLAHDVATPLLSAPTGFDQAVRAVTLAGWTGVDLFFVLSGFLITGILLDSRGQPGWWPNFVARCGFFPCTTAHWCSCSWSCRGS